VELRPYQSTLVEQLRHGYRSGITRQLAVSPTGSGKTVLFAFITKNVMERGNRVFIVAHRREILDQISATLTAVGVNHGFVQAGKSPVNRAVMVCSVQTLAKRMDSVEEPDLVIVDECFAKGTMIGDIPIERIRPGMKVMGFDGFQFVEEEVVRTFVKPVEKVMTLRFSCGRSFTCTPNHPIFTFTHGWVRADMLTPSMMLAIMPSPHELHHLLNSAAEAPKTVLGTILQVGVFPQDDNQLVQKARRGDNEVQAEQRNEAAGGEAEGEHAASCDGVEANRPWWQRVWSNCASAASRVRSWMGNGSGNSDAVGKWERIPDPLQTGHCIAGASDCCGGGLAKPSRHENQKKGRQKNRISGITWLESVEIHERGGCGRFEEMCPDGLVYNFETTRTHTYTANGVVVHNCHHSTSQTYIRMFAQWQKARFLGVTATPERLDGAGLGTLFQNMVLGPTVAWLIEQGFLAKPVYYAPRAAPPDLSKVKKLAGDFAKGELEEAFDKPAITGDAVKHYQKLCPGQRAVAFCVSVAHAQHVAAQFTAAGIPAVHIDGGMEPEVRRQAVEDLKTGKVLVLTSCELISEGFDLPTVNAAILLRPTASLSMHLQQLGRALRMFPGKKEAVILDHAGNCLRHGLAEDVREWSLEGRKKRTAKEKPVEVKTCPQCFAIFAGQECPQCHHRQEPKARELEERDGELERLTAERFQQMAEAVARRREEGACRTLEDWQRLAKQRGHKPGWAWHRYNARKAKG